MLQPPTKRGDDDSVAANKTNPDEFFNIESGSQSDFNSAEVVKKFNNDFFSNFLFLDDTHILELVDLSADDKYELFRVILTEVTSEQLQHILAEIGKIKDTKVNTIKQKLKSIFARYILEDPIYEEDINMNTHDVIHDGMFGQICLGTLKNADIYAASDASSKRGGGGDVPVAVAVELIHMTESFINKQRLGREIDALRKLSNAKCVLRMYGWIPLPSPEGSSRPVIGIVTETWHRTLTSLVTDDGFEPTIDAWLKYLLEIVKALAHIKRSGIIYRTLKADSIVITSANNAVISDLSLTFNQNYMTTRTTIMNTIRVDATNNQQMVGSIGFMAPESYKGKVNDTTDVYSLGILIAFVLLRESPWADEEHVVTYSPQMSRAPRFAGKNDFPSFQQDSLDLFQKCCDPNYKLRPSLADVEKALKKEYAEVAKQLRVMQKTKSQLNVMKNVTDIATIQGVPVPKVPQGAIKTRSTDSASIPSAAPSTDPAGNKKDLGIIPETTEELPHLESNESLLKDSESEITPINLGGAMRTINDLSFISVLSEIPNDLQSAESDDDDSVTPSVLLSPDSTGLHAIKSEGSAMKLLSQEDIGVTSFGMATESVDVHDTSHYSLAYGLKSLHKQDSHETIELPHPPPHQKKVKFIPGEEEKADDVREPINLSTYVFEVETIEDLMREVRHLQKHTPEYSSYIVIVHSIVLRLSYFMEMNPSDNAALLMSEKNVLYEIISYYQIFFTDVTGQKNATELRQMLFAIVTHWTMILIRFTYNYEDTYFQQNATPTGLIDEGNGLTRAVGLEMTVTNQTINHYHALTEAPIHTTLPSTSYDPNHPPSAMSTSSYALNRSTSNTTLTHGTVPYFHYDHILALSNQSMLGIMVWLLEQIFLEGKNLYYTNHIIQLNLLQLLLILLFPKENKQLFSKQSGLKILLLLLTRFYDADHVIIIHNVLLMIANLFYQEDNIVKLGKCLNACEILTNCLNFHKTYVEMQSSVLRKSRGELCSDNDEVSLYYHHANVELLLEIVRDLAYYIEFQFDFSQFDIVGIVIETLSMYTYHPTIILPPNQRPLSLNPSSSTAIVISQQQLLLVEKGLEAIICLSMNDANEVQFGQQGICELLHFIMKTYGFQYSKIAENSFNAIRNLSKNNDNKLKFSDIGMCELIVKLLTHYIHLTNKRSNKRSSVKRQSGSGSQSGDDNSDAGSLVADVRVKGSNSQSQENLYSPASPTPATNFPSSYPSPVPPAATSATANTSANPGYEIVKSGLSAITNLSVHPDNKRRFGECQACELVIIILYLFGKKSMEITKKALAAIGNLSVIPDNKQRFANNISTNINQAMVTIQSFEILVALIKKYALQNIDVSKKGLAAIGNLSVNNDNKIKLGQVGVNSVLYDILRTYAMANEEVAQNGLGALANLAAYSANNKEFMELHIDALVIEIMIHYESRYQIQNNNPRQSTGGTARHHHHHHSDHNVVYVEILKNGFGAINKFINNHQTENIKKFSEYNLCDGIINILKKIIINHTSSTSSDLVTENTTAGAVTSPEERSTMNNLEIIKQMFLTITFLIQQPRNVKKLRSLGLKQLLKKYFPDNEKAADILVKISRTKSLFW